MKGWQKLICRAAVIGGITFLSMMIYQGYPPTAEAFYVAGLNFGLSFLFFINTAFENDDFDGDGKPDRECFGTTESAPSLGEALKEKIQNQTKGVLKGMPNLWFP